MEWLSLAGRTLYYLLLPLTTLLGWLLVLLAPLLHMGHYLFSGFLIPLRLLAKFETLYIYFGVAAVIGLITGSILHFSSSVLVSLLNLNPVPEEKGRSAASVRNAREQKKLEQAWQSSSFKSTPARSEFNISLGKDYAEWLEKDLDKRQEGQTLFKQTILEEEDDSDEGF